MRICKNNFAERSVEKTISYPKQSLEEQHEVVSTILNSGVTFYTQKASLWVGVELSTVPPTSDHGDTQVRTMVKVDVLGPYQ